jgi:hypothetical protein
VGRGEVVEVVVVKEATMEGGVGRGRCDAVYAPTKILQEESSKVAVVVEYEGIDAMLSFFFGEIWGRWTLGGQCWL